MQVQEAQPLPPNLQEFLDSASEGAVLVSFGSTIKAELMPPERTQIFVEAFKMLNMKVIWKWDAEIADMPDNIMIR